MGFTAVAALKQSILSISSTNSYSTLTTESTISVPTQPLILQSHQAVPILSPPCWQWVILLFWHHFMPSTHCAHFTNSNWDAQPPPSSGSKELWWKHIREPVKKKKSCLNKSKYGLTCRAVYVAPFHTLQRTLQSLGVLACDRTSRSTAVISPFTLII